MKNRLLPFLAFIISISACKENGSVYRKAFNNINIPEEDFSISTGRDTSIQTSEGIRVYIEANSIISSSKIITLQIKEAMNIDEMIEGGLLTRSGNKLLSSDGMFNISTKEKSEINKPIKIEIPRNAPDGIAIKLYSGQERDGKIDWTNPIDIPNIKKDSALIDGEHIFKTNCASCHYPNNKTLVGPGLGGLANIRTKDWLYAFTRDNVKLRNEGDVLACCVYNEYNHVEMTTSTLSDKELDALYLHVKNEMRIEGFPKNYKPYRICDSCKYYAKEVLRLVDRRNNLISKNENKLNVNPNSPVHKINLNNPVIVEEKPAEYYSLTIKTYGWYNVDALLEERKDVVPSSLIVKVNLQVETPISVILVIPSIKVLTEGGKLDNNEGYGFAEKNGKIPLPQNTNAYILSYAESDGKIYFGVEKFTTKTSQSLLVTLKECSKEEMTNIIKSVDLENVDFNLDRTKNADKIEAIDSALRKLEGKLQPCSCITTDSSPVRSRLVEVPSPSEK